jgi:hypothetical protein
MTLYEEKEYMYLTLSTDTTFPVAILVPFDVVFFTMVIKGPFREEA